MLRALQGVDIFAICKKTSEPLTQVHLQFEAAGMAKNLQESGTRDHLGNTANHIFHRKTLCEFQSRRC